MGRAEISRSRGGIWGPLGPSWGQSTELPAVMWAQVARMKGGHGEAVAPGEEVRAVGGGGRGGGGWGAGPAGPARRLGTPPLPRGRPRDPFEAAVLGTRRAGPRPGGLHGCGAITQARVWAQSGRGGGPAGKARAAALARAAPRGAQACSAPRAAPARPPLGVWGWRGPAGAPRTPEPQARGGGGAGGRRRRLARSWRPAGGWAAGLRWPDVPLGGPLGTAAVIGP